MSARNRQMHFGLLMTANGSHFGGWRLPQADPAASFRLQHYVEMTREAERGCFDLVFMADTLALVPTQLPATLGHAPPIAHLEPLTLLSALSAVTTHIGLAGSATTTYNHPYQVARLFASLDHISGGRAGWNLITSGNPAEAWNFGFDGIPTMPTATIARANSPRSSSACGTAGPTTPSSSTRRVASTSSPRACVRRTTRASTSRQGPAQHGAPAAGAAGRGTGRLVRGRPRAGGRTADIVFTAQQNLKGARDFYADMKARTAACGRDPASIAVLPGVAPIIGDTDAEAQRRYQALQDAFDPLIGLDALSAEFGIDLSAYPLDAPLPEDLPTSPRATSRRDLMLEQMRREQLTLRQLGARTASLGHWVLCGTALRIADTLEEWFQGGAADGFIMMPSALPSGLGEFVRHVVPELQRRGLFRERYEGRTLREHLGLARPDL